jgi:hypothetical protein
LTWIKCSQARPQLSGVTVAIRPHAKNKRSELSIGISADQRAALGLVVGLRYDLFVSVDDHRGKCIIVQSDEGLLRLRASGAGTSYIETSSYPDGIFVDAMVRRPAVARPAGKLPSDGVIVFLPSGMVLSVDDKPSLVAEPVKVLAKDAPNPIGPDSDTTPHRLGTELATTVGQATPAPSTDVASHVPAQEPPRAATQGEAEPARKETGKFWTSERVRKVAEMKLAGYSWSAIAAEIGADVTVGAVTAQWYAAQKSPDCADLFEKKTETLAGDVRHLPIPPKPDAAALLIRSTGQACNALEQAGYHVKTKGGGYRVNGGEFLNGNQLVALANKVASGAVVVVA